MYLFIMSVLYYKSIGVQECIQMYMFILYTQKCAYLSTTLLRYNVRDKNEHISNNYDVLYKLLHLQVFSQKYSKVTS